MTHDELLIEINRRLDVALYNGDAQSIHALCAVVELHKPIGWTVAPAVRCSYCSFAYPCQTIQIVELNLQ